MPTPRRSFLRTAVTTSLGVPLMAARAAALESGAGAGGGDAVGRRTFSADGNRLRLYSNGVKEAVRVVMVADTHLWMEDEREVPFRQYSGRMARAYNATRHFQTGDPTHPRAGFEAALARASESKADLLALVGDIFSFPAEASIEWVRGRLAEAGVPWVYVAGNHDWHYEGMPGSLESLRREWIAKRLLPMYQGRNPLMASWEFRGVQFLAIDNSHYEILPEQLAFLREQIAEGRPWVLLVHIPLYAPGRSMGFGCGHPEWGAKTDRNHELERRPRWPESGHTRVTLDFHREVFASPDLLAVLAGHTHRASLDVVNGVPQVVTDANAFGAFLEVEIRPLNPVG